MNINSVSSYQNTRNFGARLEPYSEEFLLENDFSRQYVNNLKDKISTIVNDDYFEVVFRTYEENNGDTFVQARLERTDGTRGRELSRSSVKNRDIKEALRKCISDIKNVQCYEGRMGRGMTYDEYDALHKEYRIWDEFH